MRKIAIVGSGAVGSTLGALLDRAREQVYLIARPDHVRAIKENRGLQIDGIKGTFKARVQALETLDFKPDLVLLTVKTQDVASALESIREYIDGVPVLTMQNGIRSDELAAGVIGRTHLMSAMLRITCTYLDPGKVILIEQGGLVIGAPFPECTVDPKVFLDMLTKVMPTTVSSNISGVHWSKLLFNLNNALPAITGKEMQSIKDHPDMFRVVVRMMKEGLGVADSLNVRLEPIPESPVSLIKLLSLLPVGIAAQLTRIGYNKASRRLNGRPLYGSTLQSLKRGKPTEIDYLNGEIVRLGKETGVATPVNERIVEMVHEVEVTGVHLSAEELTGRVGRNR